jgi:hypothetical protein
VRCELLRAGIALEHSPTLPAPEDSNRRPL